MSFEYKTTVKLHDTDAAGLIFFARQFCFAHDACQAFMESCGFSFSEVLTQGELLIPIVHAEADYSQPLTVGDKLIIELTASRLTTHSFTLLYSLRDNHGTVVGTVETVHVTIDRASYSKMPLPKTLRLALQKIFVETD